MFHGKHADRVGLDRVDGSVEPMFPVKQGRCFP